MDLIDAWVSDAETRGVTSGTISTYLYKLRAWEAFLSKPLPEAGRADVRAYLDNLRRQGLTTKTISLHLAALSSFYEYLVFDELIVSNPVVAVRKRYLQAYKADGEEHTHKIISIEEARALVGSLIDIRDKAIVILLFKTGIRRNELISIDVDDINWKDQSILLKSKKKRSNRIVFFDDEAAYYLRRWIAVREKRNQIQSPALFIASKGGRLNKSGIYHLINSAAVHVGIHETESQNMEDHFSAHCCRHWFTTHLRRAGMPREFIQELRGDVRREAIDIYDHIDKKELRESYLAHIPQLGI